MESRGGEEKGGREFVLCLWKKKKKSRRLCASVHINVHVSCSLNQ